MLQGKYMMVCLNWLVTTVILIHGERRATKKQINQFNLIGGMKGRNASTEYLLA